MKAQIVTRNYTLLTTETLWKKLMKEIALIRKKTSSLAREANSKFVLKRNGGFIAKQNGDPWWKPREEPYGGLRYETSQEKNLMEP